MKQPEGLYAKAHKALEDLLPSLRGETLSREQIWRLLNINPNNPRHIPYKDAVNLVLWNLSEQNKKKKIVKLGSNFKVIDDSLVPIDFRQGNPSAIFDLILPLGIHEYCVMYRKNIMIIFGSKDSGKTAWMLNIIRLNMHKHHIIYWSSEMNEHELHKRLSRYQGLTVDQWQFEAYERSYDFNEVVKPDGLNLIDFLELGGDEAEYYKAVALIRKIYDVLGQGIAIIALQKNRNADYPKGGEGALEKARIALSLDPNKVTIKVAKNWADGIISSPKGKTWTYQLVGGVNIINPIEIQED